MGITSSIPAMHGAGCAGEAAVEHTAAVSVQVWVQDAGVDPAPRTGPYGCTCLESLLDVLFKK